MTVNDITSAVHTGERASGSEQQNAAVHVGFWKLCTAAVHVDTAKFKLPRP